MASGVTGEECESEGDEEERDVELLNRRQEEEHESRADQSHELGSLSHASDGNALADQTVGNPAGEDAQRDVGEPGDNVEYVT